MAMDSFKSSQHYRWRRGKMLIILEARLIITRRELYFEGAVYIYIYIYNK